MILLKTFEPFLMASIVVQIREITMVVNIIPITTTKNK